MGTRRESGIPAPLENVRQCFEQWRQSRAIRTRIPEPLWAAAVEMAKEYGVNLTAKTLRVDYYRLKKRLQPEAVPSTDAAGDPSTGTFLELAVPVASHSGECVVELEDGFGAKMRIHLKDVAVPDLVALSRSFWGVRP
jgi:hypothetical protein